MLKGTTTIGVRCADGVILATDRRVTSGFYISNKRGRKIIRIDDHVAATIAGVVADAQMLMEQVKTAANLYKLTNSRPMPVKAVATITSNILFSSRFAPYIMQAIVAGVDYTGPRMFNLDPFGTLTEERYIATGSGSPMALGVLEAHYYDGITIKEALPIVVRAVNSSMKWDPGSGEGFDIALITSLGIREVPSEEYKEG
ncbi:MAG: archaeal proteasome endopeptidase complex subunit beta [Candidatus Nezhaarchaeales archaeon]